jgi:hypothetical protein
MMALKEAVYWLNNLIGNYSYYYDDALEMGVKALEKQEIVRCGVCIHYIPMSNNWGKCGVHSSPTEKYRTCQICDYCSWSERRTDE